MFISICYCGDFALVVKLNKIKYNKQVTSLEKIVNSIAEQKVFEDCRSMLTSQILQVFLHIIIIIYYYYYCELYWKIYYNKNQTNLLHELSYKW